ncbi:ABC transporter permease [Actinomadura madurae]|uniref:ABC transporter permease n=1 Tax=Actinomadura madurae TaxID=1993 RepID=UPI0039995120
MTTDVAAPHAAPGSSGPRARRLRWPGPPVVGFLGRRLAAGLLTVFVVSVLAFVCTKILPGDTAELVLGRNASPRALEAMRERLGSNDPLVLQYFHWLRGLLTGDFGESAVALAQYQGNASISATLGDPLVNSLVLGGLTAALLVPLTMVLGAISGVRAGKLTDHLISGPSLVLGGLPEFVTGSLLIAVFFTWLQWLPPVSLVSPGASPFGQPDALVLPILTLLIVTVGSGTRQVRAGVIQALTTDYVLYARLNGVPESRVLRRYALRNALATSVQTIAQNLQYLAGGIIIVEALFTYPGIGNYLLNAVNTRDTNGVLAASMILAALYTVINIVADVVVVFLVPKLRTEML